MSATPGGCKSPTLRADHEKDVVAVARAVEMRAGSWNLGWAGSGKRGLAWQRDSHATAKLTVPRLGAEAETHQGFEAEKHHRFESTSMGALLESLTITRREFLSIRGRVFDTDYDEFRNGPDLIAFNPHASNNGVTVTPSVQLGTSSRNWPPAAAAADAACCKVAATLADWPVLAAEPAGNETTHGRRMAMDGAEEFSRPRIAEEDDLGWAESGMASTVAWAAWGTHGGEHLLSSSCSSLTSCWPASACCCCRRTDGVWSLKEVCKQAPLERSSSKPVPGSLSSICGMGDAENDRPSVNEAGARARDAPRYSGPPEPDRMGRAGQDRGPKLSMGLESWTRGVGMGVSYSHGEGEQYYGRGVWEIVMATYAGPGSGSRPSVVLGFFLGSDGGMRHIPHTVARPASTMCFDISWLASPAALSAAGRWQLVAGLCLLVRTLEADARPSAETYPPSGHCPAASKFQDASKRQASDYHLLVELVFPTTAPTAKLLPYPTPYPTPLLLYSGLGPSYASKRDVPALLVFDSDWPVSS
ncbi:hypothetical protein K402DRAFT_405355 [Aulographum hederae CBS 113979]|uniref:Uncharacterized protein n=1 Tax=Aulographum hederae CBS 113979 TaxID=1176131 RepID=A0A6G1GWR2_9PEZI|nr:hypothetical protein K402DRAFT_405355 [Aulographum hederae CBS 113979]